MAKAVTYYRSAGATNFITGPDVNTKMNALKTTIVAIKAGALMSMQRPLLGNSVIANPDGLDRRALNVRNMLKIINELSVIKYIMFCVYFLNGIWGNDVYTSSRYVMGEC